MHKVLDKVTDICVGKDARFDAWLYTMLIDNNILHDLNPQLVAAPAQLRFMAVLSENQVYLPCSDAVFRALQEGKKSPLLVQRYTRAWRITVRLIRESYPREEARIRLALCRKRFQQSIVSYSIIPSRLNKRMVEIAFFRKNDADLWEKQRQDSNAQQQELFALPQVQYCLTQLPNNCLHGSLPEIEQQIHFLTLARRMFLSMMSRPWLEELPSPAAMEQAFVSGLWASQALSAYCGINHRNMTVLFLVDAEGGTYLDSMVINALTAMGHRVIYAVKKAFHFYAPTLVDMEADPALKELREQAQIIHNANLTKNELLRLLHEHKILIISDGLQERINLCRVSVSFARAWKESDLIIAKGRRNAEVFLETEQQFTRDILCYWRDKHGAFHIQTKTRPAAVHKFSESDVKAQAERIISTMRHARKQGKSILFYSCIIGSIPGQTSVAINVVNTFVAHLRKQSDSLFVINPAEHFIEGMDGDDLMFMWEKVQRSGYIDTWRFQTTEDIEMSFQLMGKSVPPEWIGKDSTYSTGCTKEMHIALSVQEKNREMQLIGPSPRMFFRRSEYGVGKYFDASIVN